MVAEAKRGSWPQDENLWQIQCFGELDNAPGVPSELAQHLLLKLVPEPGREQPDLRTRIVQAGSGLTPSLFIGQRWRNQRFEGVERFSKFDDEVLFGDEHWRFLDGTTMVGDNQYLIPAFKYSLAPMSRVPFLAISHRGVRDALLIPCSEVTRAWYFRSTALVHRFTEAPLDEEGLDRFCRLDHSGTATDGNWVVEARTGFSETDLPVVAMLRCNQLAFQRAKRLMDSLAEAVLRGAPRYIRSLPPLDGRWRFKGDGIPFYSGGVKRFLMLRITYAPFPENPGVLHGDLESSNNSIDLGRIELKETKWPRKQQRHATENDKVSNNGEPYLDQSQIYEYGALPQLYNMPAFKKLPPREQTTTNVGRENPVAPEGDASTGQGNYVEDGSAPFNVKDDKPQRRAILAADFTELLSLAEELNKFPHFNCKPVIKSREFAGTDAAPRSLFRVQGKRKRRWTEIELRPRQFMALEITGDGKYFYAIEIERRLKPSSSDTKGECFALGILMAEDGGELDIGRFEEIMTEVAARRGVWPKSLRGIRLQKADHRSTSIAGFAALVANKIYKWIPELGAQTLGKTHDSNPDIEIVA
ncbi:MAG: hypothetical protein ACRETO_03225 [Gammaproteobacteria bacterium]